jgi:hypothetical protein
MPCASVSWLALPLALSLAVLAQDPAVVALTNGDSVRGAVTGPAVGNLLVATEFAGEVRIRMARVRSISTTGPVTLKLDTGEIDRLGTQLTSNQVEEAGVKSARNTFGSPKVDDLFSERACRSLSLEMPSDSFRDLNLWTEAGSGGTGRRRGSPS